MCTACGFVFYLDPKLSVIAVIPMDKGVVMVRRAINPGYGLWVVPGGFVDMGEVVEEAVVRETQEETYLTVRPIRLLNIYSYPDHRTIIAAYVTEYVSGELGAGMRPWRPGSSGSKRFPGPRLPFLPPKRRCGNISAGMGSEQSFRGTISLAGNPAVGCVLRTIIY